METEKPRIGEDKDNDFFFVTPRINTSQRRNYDPSFEDNYGLNNPENRGNQV